MKKEKEMLLGWAKEAENIFNEASETNFSELRRREKRAIFNSLLETGIKYDTDGDCDGTYLFVNVDEVRILFESHSEYGYPEDMAEELVNMEIIISETESDLNGLISYLAGTSTTIINLTPHAVNFYAPDGETILLTIPSSGVARAAQTRENLEDINGIPISKTTYGEVEGLPAPEHNLIYIVSVLTAQAAPDRNDLFIVDDLVRDQSGAIIGCKALAQI